MTERSVFQDAIEPSTALILGEVRGQLREIIHSMNNERMKMDSFAKSLNKLDAVPDQLQDIQRRLTMLETERNRRDGANSVVLAVLRSPAVGWIVGGAAAVWLLIRERML